MYVCICNAVTDGDIREAYAAGARTLSALQNELGVATCCGCCAPVACKVLDSCRKEQIVRIPVSAIGRPATAATG